MHLHVRAVGKKTRGLRGKSLVDLEGAHASALADDVRSEGGAVPRAGAELDERVARLEIEQTKREQVGVGRADGRVSGVVEREGDVLEGLGKIARTDEALARDLEEGMQMEGSEGAEMRFHLGDELRASRTKILPIGKHAASCESSRRRPERGFVRMAQSTRPPEKLPPVLSFALRLGKGLRAHNSFTTAAAMAFNFFLSFIPLLILAGFALGQLVRKRGIEALMEPFLDALPAAAAQLVRQQLVGLSGSGSAPVAPLSVIGFLMVASTGTHHLMDVFEVAVGAKRRVWWKQRAFALGWLMSMMGVLSIAAWALLGADSALHRGEHVTERASISSSGSAASSTPVLPVPPPATSTRSKGKAESTATVVTKAAPFKHRPFLIKHAFWEKAVVVITMLAILLTGLAVLYRFAVTHPPGVERRAWPGAALALGAGCIVSYGFGIYAATLASYTDYYGSLAAVAVVLVWLYLTSLALLLGAELNAQLEGVRVL